jgi:hypothetical protein
MWHSNTIPTEEVTVKRMLGSGGNEYHALLDDYKLLNIMKS